MVCHRLLAMEILVHVNETRQVGLQRGGVAAQLVAEGAVALFLPQPVLGPGAHQLHAVLFARRFQEVEEVVLHLDGMMQLPSQLAGVGHPDRAHRAHAQFDVAHGEPGEALVRQYGQWVGVFDDLVQHVARFGPRDGEDTPLRGHVVAFNIAELRCLVRDRLAQIVGIVCRPCPGGNEVVFILRQSDDGIFRAGGARAGQRIGQVDPPDRGQLVAGEPV